MARTTRSAAIESGFITPASLRPSGARSTVRHGAATRPRRQWRAHTRARSGPLPTHAVLFQLVIERAGLDPEQAGGLGLHAAGVRVGALDQLSLEGLEDVGEGALAAGPGEAALAERGAERIRLQ